MMQPPSADQLKGVARKYLLPRLPKGTWSVNARADWLGELPGFTIHWAEQGAYWTESLTLEEHQGLQRGMATFGETFGAALERLVERVWEHENEFVRGYA